MHAFAQTFMVPALAALCLYSTLRAEVSEVKREPAPSWVEPIGIDPSTEKPLIELDAGKDSLLAERQVNVAEKTRFAHFATKFLTATAVEDGARISVDFDPTYESIVFNQLIVHRDGKVIDHLPRQEIKILQRESRLDWHLYDGRLSAVIILEDVRVGDVLEYAYTVHGRNPIFGDRYVGSFYTGSDEPLRRQRFRLLLPSGRRLDVKDFGGAPAPIISARGAMVEYVWDQRDVPAVIADGQVPSWFDPWSRVELSEFESWGAVARWGSEIYRAPNTVPEELDREIQKIAQLQTEPSRVVAALRYVQDNIRYLGIEVGANSHKPYPIETILSRRFGDCKDKALLLCTMLRRLGFDASPALVSTDLRQTVADWLPSPLAFDHLVVYLRLHGMEFWLDGTNRDQGGKLEEMYFPAFGEALVRYTPRDSGRLLWKFWIPMIFRISMGPRHCMCIRPRAAERLTACALSSPTTVST